MAFNVREGYWGLEHLRLKLCRRLFNLKADLYYINRYANDSRVEILHSQNGQAELCSRCGFVLLKVSFETGWHMEMCSALPLVNLDNPKFTDWRASLFSNEIESAKTAREGAAILQD